VKFENEGIDADYSLIELDDISSIDSVIAERELSGFNVTVPYKESIIPYLDELSIEAEAAGAVNCVVVRNGRKIGYNTDITGIEASLEWLDKSRALILGTGGASKAVQYVCKKHNIPYSIVSRSADKGDYTYGNLTAEVITEHTLIINTTPVGMFPNVDDAPQLPYDSITERHSVFDLVYNPAKTQLLSRAEERGATTMNGILMLQTQAIASWHIWPRKEKEPSSDNSVN
jgi:shikimate dehydrogenase